MQLWVQSLCTCASWLLWFWSPGSSQPSSWSPGLRGSVRSPRAPRSRGAVMTILFVWMISTIVITIANPMSADTFRTIGTSYSIVLSIAPRTLVGWNWWKKNGFRWNWYIKRLYGDYKNFKKPEMRNEMSIGTGTLLTLPNVGNFWNL